MNAKSLFLADKELIAFWRNSTGQSNFDRVMVFARAEFMSRKPSREEIKGAEDMLEILSTIADNEETSVPIPGPGLVHRSEKMPEPPPTP